MSKGAMAAVVVRLGVCLGCFAPQTCPAQGISRDGFRLDNPGLFPTPATPTLFNSELISSSNTLAWMRLGNSLPAANTPAPQNVTSPATSARNLPDRLNDWLSKDGYVTGEVGFLYGRSTGKFGGELKQGYIIGETGDDKFHITVGAAYEESSFHFPRHN